MRSRLNVLVITGICLASFLPNVSAAANEFTFECGSVPTCGKVCKLVCETKKLTAVCYACECDEICIPGPSRRGCKHCATCGGEQVCSECDSACPDCRDHTPQCEFCWRDWFACGCAKPRTVKVLTKYQAEKEIDWYQWEVVDAACCECVASSGQAAANRCVYKPAPVDAELGEVLAVSEEEWAELASVVSPDENLKASQVAVQPPLKAEGDSNSAAPEAEGVSIAERLGRLFK